MTEQRSKQFVEGFISTEMPTVFMAINSYVKTLKVWKLWYPLEGTGVPITSGTTSWLLWNTAVHQGSYSLRAHCEQWPEEQQEQSGHTGSVELVSLLAVSPSHRRSGPKAEPGATLQGHWGAARAQARPRCCGVWRVPAPRVLPVSCTGAGLPLCQPEADGQVSV